MFFYGNWVKINYFWIAKKPNSHSKPSLTHLYPEFKNLKLTFE